MAGKVVETQDGLKGYTKNEDPTKFGKVLVYLENGKKILCDPKKLKPVGYWR